MTQKHFFITKFFRTKWFFALICLVKSGAFGQDSAVLSLSLVNRSGPFFDWALKISGPRLTNFVVELSEDLKEWRPLLHVKTTNANQSIQEIALGLTGTRFYRARSPVESAVKAKRFWDDLAISSYSFRLKRTCFCTPTRLSGIVRVRDGKVVSVEDAFDEFPSKPIANPELSAFKSIDELLGVVVRAERGSAKSIVEYDPDRGYPRSIVIDWFWRTIDDEIEYEVNQFQVEP